MFNELKKLWFELGDSWKRKYWRKGQLVPEIRYLFFTKFLASKGNKLFSPFNFIQNYFYLQRNRLKNTIDIWKTLLRPLYFSLRKRLVWPCSGEVVAYSKPKENPDSCAIKPNNPNPFPCFTNYLFFHYLHLDTHKLIIEEQQDIPKFQRL